MSSSTLDIVTMNKVLIGATSINTRKNIPTIPDTKSYIHQRSQLTATGAVMRKVCQTKSNALDVGEDERARR
jgi:hypothetical protein